MNVFYWKKKNYFNIFNELYIVDYFPNKYLVKIKIQLEEKNDFMNILYNINCVIILIIIYNINYIVKQFSGLI